MVKKIVFGIVLNALALYVVTKFLPEIQYTGGIAFFIVGGTIIGFVNTFVKPIMKLLSLPLVLITVGLFLFVINAIVFWLTVQIVNGINIADVTITVESPLAYFMASIIFGLVNWALHLLIHNK